MWKPLSGPLSDWPLACCLRQDGLPNVANEALDVVFPDRVREIALPYYGSGQEWVYLKDQKESEYLLFLQGEISTNITSDKNARSIAHASFDNPEKRLGEAPRSSIEVKLLVSYLD